MPLARVSIATLAAALVVAGCGGAPSRDDVASCLKDENFKSVDEGSNERGANIDALRTAAKEAGGGYVEAEEKEGGGTVFVLLYEDEEDAKQGKRRVEGSEDRESKVEGSTVISYSADAKQEDKDIVEGCL